MSVFKQLGILILLAALGYGGFEAWKIYGAPPQQAETDRGGPRVVTVEIAPVTVQTVAETVEAVGTTRAIRSVEIVPEADGRVVELNLISGQRVAEGDVLVRLDDTIERADLAEAQARRTEQRQALARIEQLRSTNAVSQATLEESTARLAEAEAQLERAQRRLSDRVITAPFDGVVGLSEIDQGARITEGQPITRVDDLGEVEIEFSLPETLFARVRPGLEVSAASAAFPARQFDGAIDAVDSRIDPVSRAFRTRAVLPNPDGILPAGMFMSLRLILSEAEALTVPEEAIVFQAAETYVFLADGDTATRMPVETGKRSGGRIAILSGLTEGQQVVIRGLGRLRDGAAIRVLGAPEATAPDADGDT